MRIPAWRALPRLALLLALSAVLLLAGITPASAQNDNPKDKKKKKNAAAADASGSGISLPDEQRIDYMISEMLGAWQVGNIDKLHKDYADDVTLVNGTYGPPIIGWTNYLAIYQQQRARMQQIRMDRLNTYIRVNGNVGWACYQWDFSATVDGQPSTAQGQTTLVLEKRADQWVIVHNHTSLATQSAQPTAPSNAPATTQPSSTKPGAS